jgi:hypothetical protein
MNLAAIVEKLTAAYWVEEEISDLPKNALNEGVQAHLSYKGRLSFRYHPEQGYIRLMIYGRGDVRGLQIEYGDKLKEVLDKLVSIQDDLSLDSYLTHYLELQSICPISILMVEQFL